jgi:hypothetical protein
VRLGGSCLAAASIAWLTGCQDLKPLQAQVSDLRVEVAGLQAQAEAAERAARQAQTLARAAPETARAAEQSSSVALTVAQGAKTASADNDERLDRVLQRHSHAIGPGDEPERSHGDRPADQGDR